MMARGGPLLAVYPSAQTVNERHRGIRSAPAEMPRLAGAVCKP